jgi:hypothetical protein
MNYLFAVFAVLNLGLVIRDRRAARAKNKTIAELRALISEREFMVEATINQAYEQGWNARTAFSGPMPLARVRPDAEKSN